MVRTYLNVVIDHHPSIHDASKTFQCPHPTPTSPRSPDMLTKLFLVILLQTFPPILGPLPKPTSTSCEKESEWTFFQVQPTEPEPVPFRVDTFPVLGDFFFFF